MTEGVAADLRSQVLRMLEKAKRRRKRKSRRKRRRRRRRMRQDGWCTVKSTHQKFDIVN